MAGLSFVEGVQLLISLGVFSGGVGIAGWMLRMERRVQTLEIIEDIRNGKTKKA